LVLAASAEGDAGSFMTKKILVVDDEPDVLKFVTLRLKKAGYLVAAAMDGKAALEMMADGIPDLVLLDIKLPKMNGYEVCRHMKKNSELAKIPIILVTADASVSIARHSTELQVNDYILKPYHAEELFKKIAQCLDEHS
jgi:two-component system alkaline phosphatase synthesis response regulator PhoP